MRDIKDLCARIEDELSKIADSGLTTGNLEMTYKLIDMYKDIKNTYYWDKKVEYYNTVLDEMRSGYNDDYSERGRKRDSMGRYSANDGRMMPDYDRGNSYARRGEHYVRGITAVLMDEMLTMIIWRRNKAIVPASLKTAKGRCLPLWKNIWTNLQQK